MKANRELLELAAKAAGYEIWTDEYDNMLIPDPMRKWNPLTDDGDALRLAVKLRLEFEWWKTGISANHSSTPIMPIEHVGDDACAATRRAIVRAAAALGEQA